MREPLRLSRRSAVVGWWLSCVLGGVLLATGFGRAYPLLPERWSVMRADAEVLGVEALRVLGGVADQPKLVSRLEVDSALEMRLLREGVDRLGAPGTGRRRDRLARRVLSWSVTLLPEGGVSGDWTHRARISLTGDIWTLERRLAESGGGGIFPGEARLEASKFLSDQGFSLNSFDVPVVLRQELPERTDLLLRYRRLDPFWGERSPYGVEVVFSGGTLLGYRAWREDPDEAEDLASLRTARILSLLERSLILLALPVLALVTWLQSRRKQNLGSAPLIVPMVLAAGVFVASTAAAAAALDWDLAPRSAETVRWIWLIVVAGGLMPLLGVVGSWSWRLRASPVSRWGHYQRALDDLLQIHWSKPRVGEAALRGTGAGLLMAGLGIWALALLDTSPAPLLSTFWWTPWWRQAAWPGLSAGMVISADIVCRSLFVGVFLVPRLVDGMGRLVGSTVAAIVTGIVLGLPIEFLSLRQSFPAVVLFGALIVALNLRYGFATGLLAAVVTHGILWAQPLVHAPDPRLQIQGWVTIVWILAPAIWSVHQVGRRKNLLAALSVTPGASKGS